MPANVLPTHQMSKDSVVFRVLQSSKQFTTVEGNNSVVRGVAAADIKVCDICTHTLSTADTFSTLTT